MSKRVRLDGPTAMPNRVPQFAVIVGAGAIIASVVLFVASEVGAVAAYEKQVAISKNEERVTVFRRVVEREIRKLEAVSTLLEAEGNDRPTFRSAVKQTFGANDEILSAYYWRDGDLTRASDFMDIAAGEEAEMKQYIARNIGGPFISPPFNDASGRAFLLFSDGPRVSAETDNSEAILAIDPKVLVDHSEGTAFEPGDLISLIGLDGITRARRTDGAFSTGENLAGKLVMQKQLADPDGTYEGPNGLTGEQSIFTHRRLPEYDVFATSGLSIDRVKGAVRREARAYWIGLASFVILSLISIIVFVRSLERQRRQLFEVNKQLWRLEQAQRLGRIGDWEYNPDDQTFLMSRGLIDAYAFDDGQESITLEEFVDAMSGRSASEFRGAIYRALATGEPQYIEIETLAGADDGRNREVTIGAMQENGQIHRLYGIDRDISREKKLGALRARMSVLARLDALSALAATIAHELRQPLTAAKTFLAAGIRTVENGNADDASTLFEKSMSQIQFASEIVVSASRDIRGSGSSDETFEIASVVNDVGELLRNFYENKSFRIEFTGAPHTEIAKGVHSQGKQIFFNLIKNSIEAMPPGEECNVTIRTEALVEGMIGVWVQDNGSGLADSAEPFTLFASTKTRGMGLGMSLTRTLVEGLGGEIRVDKTGPSGTTIYFTLVAAREGEYAQH